MKRSELEHIVRTAGAIANDREIVVVGSQSILGQFPNAPVALLASMEAEQSRSTSLGASRTWSSRANWRAMG